MMTNRFTNMSLDFELFVHVKPGAQALVTVTVCIEDCPCKTLQYQFDATLDWQLDATTEKAHSIMLTLPVARFNLVTIASEYNDILVLGYRPQQPGVWRFASVPQWNSGQLYNAPDQFDEDPHALPILQGDSVSFYCRAIATFPENF